MKKAEFRVKNKNIPIKKAAKLSTPLSITFVVLAVIQLLVKETRDFLESTIVCCYVHKRHFVLCSMTGNAPIQSKTTCSLFSGIIKIFAIFPTGFRIPIKTFILY